MNIKILPVLLIAAFTLISCGGGGGGGSSSGGSGGSGGGTTFSGSTSPATVDANNADELAIAAAGGAKQAIGSDNAPGAKASPAMSILLEHSSQLTKMLSQANRTANQPIEGFCTSGSADVVSNSSGSSSTITYNNCVVASSSASITVDGVATITSSSSGAFTLVYSNFTMSYLGETYTLNMTISCDSSANCTYSSDFAGPDGRIYRVEGATVASTGSNNYTVTATVYDPDFGAITIDANITYGDCAGGVPISGSITYTGSAGSSGSVVFNDCDSFTVTQDGTAVAYNWADIL